MGALNVTRVAQGFTSIGDGGGVVPPVPFASTALIYDANDGIQRLVSDLPLEVVIPFDLDSRDFFILFTINRGYYWGSIVPSFSGPPEFSGLGFIAPTITETDVQTYIPITFQPTGKGKYSIDFTLTGGSYSVTKTLTITIGAEPTPYGYGYGGKGLGFELI